MRVPDRDTLQNCPPLPLHSGRNWTKAEIYLWDDPDHRLVIKDYSHRPKWLRDSLGRFLIGRELAAYRRLTGVEGIPPLAGRVDSHALALGFVEGKDLSRIPRGDVSLEFFAELQSLVAAIHEAGVAHGDLHHRDILRGPEGRPFVVDFSTSIILTPGAGFLRRRFFAAACLADRRSILKQKQRHHPGSLTSSEQTELEHEPFWYRLGKGIRAWIPRTGPGRGTRT